MQDETNSNEPKPRRKRGLFRLSLIVLRRKRGLFRLSLIVPVPHRPLIVLIVLVLTSMPFL
jgi:hypothetical protein